MMKLPNIYKSGYSSLRQAAINLRAEARRLQYDDLGHRLPHDRIPWDRVADLGLQAGDYDRAALAARGRE